MIDDGDGARVGRELAGAKLELSRISPAGRVSLSPDR